MGPPAIGKSTFIAKFVLEHPYWTYVDIEACRQTTYVPDSPLCQNERHAWDLFQKEITNNQDVIIESAGLYWDMPRILTETQLPVITIELVCNNIADLNMRIRKRRIAKPLPPPFRVEDELLMVDLLDQELKDWIKLLPNVQVHEILVDGYNCNELYQILSNLILTSRLKIYKEQL